MEGLLEEMHIKLSSYVSDLFGVSGLRMLKALAEGETDPGRLAAMADHRLRATSAQLNDALGAGAQLNPVYRELLKLSLQSWKLMKEQTATLNQRLAELLAEHQTAVHRLAEVPGLNIESAQQIVTVVGPQAATFPSAKQLAGWVGVCPGREESAEESHSNRSPKGNCTMRRVLNQAANAAIRVKGSIFEVKYRSMVGRLGHKQAIWAIAHRLCRLIWKILHQGVRYEERGPAVSENSKRAKTAKMIKQLRKLGYRVEPLETLQLEGAQ